MEKGNTEESGKQMYLTPLSLIIMILGIIAFGTGSIAFGSHELKEADLEVISGELDFVDFYLSEDYNSSLIALKNNSNRYRIKAEFFSLFEFERFKQEVSTGDTLHLGVLKGDPSIREIPVLSLRNENFTYLAFSPVQEKWNFLRNRLLLTTLISAVLLIILKIYQFKKRL